MPGTVLCGIEDGTGKGCLCVCVCVLCVCVRVVCVRVRKYTYNQLYKCTDNGHTPHKNDSFVLKDTKYVCEREIGIAQYQLLEVKVQVAIIHMVGHNRETIAYSL